MHRNVFLVARFYKFATNHLILILILNFLFLIFEVYGCMLLNIFYGPKDRMFCGKYEFVQKVRLQHIVLEIEKWIYLKWNLLDKCQNMSLFLYIIEVNTFWKPREEFLYTLVVHLPLHLPRPLFDRILDLLVI